MFGVKPVVKGVSKRVIVVKSPDQDIFDEAIFIVKEDILQKSGVSQRDVLREAQRVANEYVRKNVSGKVSKTARIPAPVFAVIGALIASVIFVIANL